MNRYSRRLLGVDVCNAAPEDDPLVAPAPEHVRECPVCSRRMRIIEAQVKGWAPVDCDMSRQLTETMAANLAARKEAFADSLSRGFYAHLATCQDCEAQFALECASEWPEAPSWVTVDRLKAPRRVLRLLSPAPLRSEPLAAANQEWQVIVEAGGTPTEGSARVLVGVRGNVVLSLRSPHGSMLPSQWVIRFPDATGTPADGIHWWIDQILGGHELTIPMPATPDETTVQALGRLVDNTPETRSAVLRACATMQVIIEEAPRDGEPGSG